MANKRTEREHAGIEGDWIKVGSIGSTHGVRGDVRLKSFMEKPAAIFKLDDLRLGAGGTAVSLRKVRSIKDGFVVHIDGVNAPEEAEALKTKGLYVARDSFADSDEDEFFLADLIGLTAVDEVGRELGVVATLENFGAEDLLELVLQEPIKGLGRHVFIPFRKALVPDVRLSAGEIVINFAEWQATQTSERDQKGIENKGENS